MRYRYTYRETAALRCARCDAPLVLPASLSPASITAAICTDCSYADLTDVRVCFPRAATARITA